MNPYTIRTQQLTRDFSSVRALDGLTLEVPRGIIFGFLGPNGSGKTTTIHLLLGLLEPTSGRAEILGYDTRSQGDEIRLRCGALLEHTGLYERLNALDNLDFYARIWHLPDTQRKVRIKEVLTNMDLWDRRTDTVGTWSRGMKQKLAIARAMLHRPELIFLDEPTAGLDPVAAAALHENLLSLVAKEGVTVFLTTHNLAEAEKICTQVAVIRQGKLLKVGSPETLKTGESQPRLQIIGRDFNPAVLAALSARPEVNQVQAEDGRLWINLNPDVTDTAPLVSLVIANGAQIEEVRRDHASLEEAFLTLVEEEKATGTAR